MAAIQPKRSDNDMDVNEVADTIKEAVEAEHEIDKAEAHRAERHRNRSALAIAVLAAVLAVGELGGDNAKDAMIHNNIEASDTWNFYQAKNIRQTVYKLQADALARDIAAPGLAADRRAALQGDMEKYRKTAARYEDEPDAAAPGDATKGEGKKQLQARAKAYQEARALAEKKNDSFDFAKMALQLGIVLGSVSILATSRPLLWLAAGLGVVGAILTLNGFLLLFPVG
jgi:hypothetical protein